MSGVRGAAQKHQGGSFFMHSLHFLPPIHKLKHKVDVLFRALIVVNNLL